MSEDHWPFDQPKNCAVLLSKAVMEGETRITLVEHSASDHGWTFSDDFSHESQHFAVVGLAQVVQLDPSVLEIADLEPGWSAIRRPTGAKWKRRPVEE